MRFRLVIPFASILIIAAGTPMLAQRGGGHPGHAGHAGSGFSGAHAGAHAPTLPTPIGLIRQPGEYTGINRGALRSSRPERGRGRVAPGFVYPYYSSYLPYLPLDYDSSIYDSSPSYGYGYGGGQDPGEQTAEVTASLLGEQIQRLSGEVEQLRSEQQYAPPPYAPQGNTNLQNDPPPAVAPVILVLRNGQQIQVQSYAVMDKTFWDFSKQPARRIPLSAIDIAASSKATLASGGDFPQIDD
ncbi:MAG TPA: hypothetical protein VGL97_09885 [Bryobacteraceae bacterium]|jgi:hypothetical protein